MLRRFLYDPLRSCRAGCRSCGEPLSTTVKGEPKMLESGTCSRGAHRCRRRLQTTVNVSSPSALLKTLAPGLRTRLRRCYRPHILQSLNACEPATVRPFLGGRRFLKPGGPCLRLVRGINMLTMVAGLPRVRCEDTAPRMGTTRHSSGRRSAAPTDSSSCHSARMQPWRPIRERSRNSKSS